MKKITLQILLGIMFLFSAAIHAQANDNIANAEAVVCGSVYSGTTATATLDQANPSLFFGVDLDAPNVWYTYTGSGFEETITLDLCGSSYDTSILVLTGSPGSLTAIAGNDDDSTCSSNTLNSRISFTSDGTTTYYIAVEGYNLGSVGAYTLNISCTGVTPPTVDNQNCALALSINVDGIPIASDNSFGDTSATQPTCDSFGSAQDVWFSFVAPTSGTVDVTVTGTSMTSVNFASYSGICGALTSIGCSSNLTASGTQSLTALIAGDTYFVQVWSNAAEQGAFELSLTDPGYCLPVVTYGKYYDCSSSTFNVTATISSLASASSVTVTDDQGSSSQTVFAADTLTFGPYAFGTSVVLTATNDQSPVCTVVSTAQTVLACPPTNDECATALTLSCGDVLTAQTTDGANGGTTTSCIGTIGNDIWYTFVGDGQILTLTATASVEFPQVEVYQSTDGTCSGFTPGSCIASAGSGQAALTVSFASQNGVTYYAHVGNYINGNPAVLFDISLTCAASPTAPDNDDCSGAFALTVNPDASCASVVSATLVGATASAVDATSCGGTEDDDVWFSFVAENTIHTINLNNVVGSTTDLYHSLWIGDCASLSLVPGTCSDPNNSQPTGLVVGQTYYLRVYSFTGTALQTTTFDVCIGIPPPPPANDDCTGAIELLATGGTFASNAIVSNNISATTTTGLTFGCQTNRVNDVWYTVVVPASGVLTIETDTTSGTLMTDSVMSVFSGTCGTLVEIGCDDDSGNTTFSKVSLTGLTAGDILYVGLWRYSVGTGLDGQFLISAYDPTLMSAQTFDAVNFRAYPNPVKDVLNLSYNKNISNVAVFNMLGQEVFTKSLNANQSRIDISQLSKGTYMVKVTADNQVKTIKVSKE